MEKSRHAKQFDFDVDVFNFKRGVQTAYCFVTWTTLFEVRDASHVNQAPHSSEARDPAFKSLQKANLNPDRVQNALGRHHGDWRRLIQGRVRVNSATVVCLGGQKGHRDAASSWSRRGRSATTRQGLFTLGDAQSFFGLTSKILPLGSMLNFDADVNKMTARHQCENRFTSEPYTVNRTRSSQVLASSWTFLHGVKFALLWLKFVPS